MRSIDSTLMETYCDPRYNYPNVFRYIYFEEFDNIFNQKQLRFKDPREWIETDEYEVFFERIWDNIDNVRLLANKVIEATNLKYSYMGVSESLENPKLYSLLKILLLNSSYKHSLCFTTDWSKKKIMDEYHGKWNRNIVIEFYPDFLKSLSIVKHPPLGSSSTYLYIDYFPMRYINDFNIFINELCSTDLLQDESMWERTFFNIGYFLKHCNYSYENEIRAILQLSIQEEKEYINSFELTHDINCPLCQDKKSKNHREP